jgi:Polyketide cyclase / dehydrase and lipid transport
MIMELKLKPTAEPISAEMSTVVNHEPCKVFEFIADRFHENYQQWMPDVVELEPLDGIPLRRGSRVRQVRLENEEMIQSTFEVLEFEKCELFSFQGIDMPYRQVYRIEAKGPDQSEITFRFELLEIELFMRPFVKLLRSAISEGVENTVQSLTTLLEPA